MKGQSIKGLIYYQVFNLSIFIIKHNNDAKRVNNTYFKAACMLQQLVYASPLSRGHDHSQWDAVQS